MQQQPPTTQPDHWIDPALVALAQAASPAQDADNSNPNPPPAGIESAQSATESVAAAAAFDLDALELQEGAHSEASGQFCLYEAVAKYDNQPHTFKPKRVCITLREIGVRWNDWATHAERQELKQYIPRLPNTDLGRQLSEERAWHAIDWAFRDMLPIYLSALDFPEQAAALSALNRISGQPALSLALPAINQAICTALAARPDLSALSALSALAARAARADLSALAARADLSALAARPDLSDLSALSALSALAARADLSALSALAALAARADLSALAARADLVALADLAARADRAEKYKSAATEIKASKHNMFAHLIEMKESA